MNPNYDSQIQNLENQARQAKEEEDALLAVLQRNTAEIQQLKANIGGLESQKKELQQQLVAQSAPMGMPQGSPGPPGPPGAPGAQGYQASPMQSPMAAGIQKRIAEIDSQIGAMISKIEALVAENSLIQTSKIPAAKQKLAEALSRLSQLKSELMNLGRTYHNASQQLYGTRMKEAKEAQSYLDQGASVAKDQYHVTQQRVAYVDRVIGQYSSSSGTNQFAGAAVPGSYFVTPSASNNYSLLNGRSIDSVANGYNSGASYSTLDRFFDSASSTPSASCLRQHRNPSHYSSASANRQSNQLTSLEYRLNSKDYY